MVLTKVQCGLNYRLKVSIIKKLCDGDWCTRIEDIGVPSSRVYFTTQRVIDLDQAIREYESRMDFLEKLFSTRSNGEGGH